MSRYLDIHPLNPQPWLIQNVVDILRRGGVIAYPTDSCYALGCLLGEKTAMERIRRIRDVSKDHNFTLVCRDLSEISTYARIDNSAYRLLKSRTPGPYTFILRATHEVPRRLQHPKRKTIGIRVPENTIALALLGALDQPLMSSTLLLAGSDMPLTQPDEILTHLNNDVDLIIDGGYCGHDPTTVLDLVSGVPKIVRQGRGEAAELV